MKALPVLLALLALALAASAALSPGPVLLLAAVALAVRAVEGIYAWAESRQGTSVRFATGSQSGKPAPPAYPGEPVVATIYLRSGRLVLVRRRAS